MVVTFLGHRDFIPDNECKERMISIFDELVGDNAVEFYLGGYGRFDDFAYSCCEIYAKAHKKASLVFVTPYITEEYQRNHLAEIEEKYHSIIYPEIERVPKRFAITYRNRYMVDKADLVICYVKREWGGAFNALKYARARKKTIINLADIK